MSYNPWLIGGVFLAALEIFLPGGFSGAVALATLMIAALVYLEWLTTFPVAFGLWLILSAICLLTVRKVMQKLSPNQTSVGSANHEDQLRGTDVVVTDAIQPGRPGRVLVAGTTWTAVLTDPAATAPTGTHVRLVSRDNITWTVTAPLSAGEDS